MTRAAFEYVDSIFVIMNMSDDRNYTLPDPLYNNCAQVMLIIFFPTGMFTATIH